MAKKLFKITESQLKEVLKESIKIFLTEGSMSTNAKYYPGEDVELSDEEYELMSQYLRDVYDVSFEGYSSYDEGDYYTPPSGDFNASVRDDDGFMRDVQNIPNEQLKAKLINEFNEWCESVSENERGFEPDDDFDEF